MPHATASPSTARTVLNYHLEPAKGGVAQTFVGTTSVKRRKHVPIPTSITDMRGHEEDFSLDKQGFQLIQSTTSLISTGDGNGEKDDGFADAERVKNVYYKECEELVKKT